MKKTITIVALAVGIAMSMGSVSAQDSTQDAVVNVTVDGATELDVRPTTLSYNQSSGLQPGEQATSTAEYNGYSAIEVENIGSNNISRIYAEASYPDDDPFGTGVDSNYDSGNFIQINTNSAVTGSYGVDDGWDTSLANDATDQEFHYTNRVEFEDDPVPTYITTVSDKNNLQHNSGEISNLNTDVGRFKEGDQWYFYALYYGDNGNGACSGGSGGPSELWVGNEAHTPTSTGTTDLSDTSKVTTTDIQQTTDGAVGVTNNTVSLDANGVTKEYDVFTWCDADQDVPGSTMRTRFNTEPTFNVTQMSDAATDLNVDSGSLSSSTDILNGGSTENLNPGSYFPVDVTVELPQGVAAGAVEGGELSIQAVSQ